MAIVAATNRTIIIHPFLNGGISGTGVGSYIVIIHIPI